MRAEFFTLALGLSDRSHADRAPYELWVQRGLITATPGASVDYDCVALRLAALAEEYSIEAVYFDRWRMDVLEAALKRLGVTLPMVPHGQGFKDMAPAVDQLESLLLNRKIRHGGNPVLRMCASNAIVVSDAAGNRKFDKSRSRARIDGIVALAMTMARPLEAAEVAVSGTLVAL